MRHPWILAQLLLGLCLVGGAEADEPTPVKRVTEHGVLKQTAVLFGHGALVRSLAWSPADRTLVSGGSDASLRLWNLRTRKEKRYIGFPAGG